MASTEEPLGLMERERLLVAPARPSTARPEPPGSNCRQTLRAGKETLPRSEPVGATEAAQFDGSHK